MDGTLRAQAQFLVPAEMVCDSFYDIVEKAFYDINVSAVTDICKQNVGNNCIISTGFEMTIDVDVDDSNCYSIPCFIDRYGDYHEPIENYEPAFHYDGNAIVQDVLNSLLFQLPITEVILKVNHIKGMFSGDVNSFEVNEDVTDSFVAKQTQRIKKGQNYAR